MSNPSPARRRWSQIGNVVRRSGSLLSVNRSTTPSNDRDSDSVSLGKQSKKDSSPSIKIPSEGASAMVPSPIAESPMREAEATAEPVGPSRLAYAGTTSTIPAEGGSEPGSPPEPLSGVASPTGYVPPPLLDSSAGNPGAFTDDPDSLPQPTIVEDPYASRSQLDVTLPRTPEPRSPPVLATTANPGAFTDDTDLPQISIIQDPFAHPEAQPRAPPSAPVPAQLAPDPSTSSFASRSQPEARTPPPVQLAADPSTSSDGLSSNYGAGGRFFGKPIVESMHSNDDSHSGFAAAVDEHAELAAAIEERSVAKPNDREVHQPQPKLPEPSSPPEPQYTLPAYDSGGHDVWGGQPVVNAPPQEGQSSRAPLDDPFFISVPRTAPQLNIPQLTRAMPEPQHAAPTVQILPVESQQHSTLMMPLPPAPSFPNATISQPLREMPSTSSFLQARNQASVGYDVNETQPLLGNGSAKLQPYVRTGINDQNQPWVPAVSNLAAAPPRLHELGWLEYHLPDGSFYYVHPTRHITTDVNLRVDKVLTEVTNYLESGGDSGSPSVSAGGEVWLRDFGNAKKGFVPAKCFVDHHARTVTLDRVVRGKGKKKAATANDEDQLDMEFRYWSFMESHPAHTVLPVKSRNEALDVLTWAWTDRLLPSHREIPAPFGQEECNELMILLRSFNNENSDNHGIQTRIVSRILLRVALWRQQYFRPNKALPKDVKSSQLHLPTQHRPIRRAFFDFVISCVCLGIPYLFLERARTQRIDEESGFRSAGPVFIIGACTCLVAAIVLSASVTFLSLPGLDGVARVAGLVAVLFASFSMASTLVAFLRYKTDLEQPVSFVGLEGLMNISRRAVVLSLPLVFLAYSILGFIVAIVLYSFRGASLAGPAATVTGTVMFAEYTRWTAMGLVGAFGGVLATTWITMRL